MAYGQTGSGKTFTMGNCMEAKEEDKGITPRTIDEVFRRVEEMTDSSFIIRATYVEVYNEEIYDLFAADDGQKFTRNKSRTITLREEKDGSIILCGVREEKIDDKEQLYLLLEQGSQRRSVGSTMMNDESSRSHAIFTLIIEKSAIADEKDFVSSRFSFVDLAGSERLGRTEAVGRAMKEGININKGLLALGNVISALTDDTGKVNFIPYRVSKLTRILRNSLGGNSRTWMVACVSPVLADLDESLNTIKYATRARKISNTPIINKDPQSAIIAQLKQQVFKLQGDVVRMKRVIHQNGLSVTLEAMEDGEEAGDIEGTPRGKGTADMRIARVETMNVDEANSEWELRFKAIERENLKLKEERNRIKKDLNEKNILYCRLISRINDLRQQNAKLVAMFQQMTSIQDQSMDPDSNHMVEVAEAIASATKASEGSESEVSVLLREVDGLKNKLAERSKYATTLEDEYTKLLRVSTKENELLVGKIKECSELERQFRQLEKSSAVRRSDLQSSMLSQGEITPPLTSKPSEDQSNVPSDLSTVQATESTKEAELDEDDLKKYEEEKKAKEEELRQLQASLEEKEVHLKEMMERDNEDVELDAVSVVDLINLDKLTELEQELMDAKKERDEAIKQLHDGSGAAQGIHRSQTDVDRAKLTRKNSEALKESKDGGIDLNKYKQRVTALEQQVQEMRKKDKEVKEMDSRMKLKTSKIEHLMTEVQKMKEQRLGLDKKLREGSSIFVKTKMEKQKEIVSIKKELFKKTTEVTRLKNLTRKQDLSYHKKLADLRRGHDKDMAKKKVKKVTASSFEGIDVGSFSGLMETFCGKIIEHVELEEETGSQTQALLKYHTKLDELLTEISKLEAEKQTAIETENLDDEILMLEAKQSEFETNIASCEEAIKIKRHFIGRLEAQLEEVRSFLNEGFANLLIFLNDDKSNREEFWETALNVMMIQLEICKKAALGKTSELRAAEATSAESLKSLGEIKRMNAKLEAEIDRLKLEVEEKETEIMQAKEVQEENMRKEKAEEDAAPKPPVFKHAHNQSLRQDRTENRERGSSGIRKLDLDGLRNKLINSEIQKEGAMKMAETLREKYIKMQDILSTMMDSNKGPVSERGLLVPPPEPVKMTQSRADKFIRTHKRFGLGNMTMRPSTTAGTSSVNTSMNQDDNNPLNISSSRKGKANEAAQSREPSANRRMMKNIVQSAASRQIQNKLNLNAIKLDALDSQPEVNLYSKELQYKKLGGILTEHPVVGVFEMGDKLLVDMKREMCLYDLKHDFAVGLRKEYAPSMGKIVGVNPKE